MGSKSDHTALQLYCCMVNLLDYLPVSCPWTGIFGSGNIDTGSAAFCRSNIVECRGNCTTNLCALYA
uniref:Uncharacterized protein n=1 Tax=Romanomermis culicivorax TaxID=13658 RepID=A0A915ITS0_ROMCU